MALNVQSNAAAKVPAGLDALFAALLLESAQPATPANDAAQPVTPNDNTNSQTDSVVQTQPQADGQTAQDLPNLIALLQNAVPQHSVQASENTDATPAADRAAKTDPKSAAATAQAAQSQSADAATKTVAAATASLASDTPPAPQNDPKQATDVKLPATNDPQNTQGTASSTKNDQKATSDTASTTQNDARIATDANLIVTAMLSQQTQAAASQSQATAGNAATATKADAAPAVSDAKPTNVRGAGQAPTDKPSTDAKQVVADNNGEPKTDASIIGVPKTDTPTIGAPKTDAPKMVDGTKSDATTATAQPASAQDVAPVPMAQSSASGQSASTPVPTVAATAVQAPAGPTSDPSVYVNLQVAPQHHDAASTSTMDTLGLAIAAKTADGIKHFDIRLDPPELGRVEIHLSLDNSGKAQANLVIDKPQTLELMQRDTFGLTQSLNNAGVSLSNNGLNFSLRGQDRQSDSGSVVKGRSRALSVKAVVGTDAISNSSSIASLAPDSVRLDIRV